MSQAPEVRQYIERMRGSSPIRARSQLSPVADTSLRLTLMQEAWQQSDDHSLDDPGEVDQWFFPDQEIVVIDLKQDPDRWDDEFTK